MAHTYEDALREEAAAAAARGQDTTEIGAELERIGGKLAEPHDVPEALGSPSAGDELIGAEKPDPMDRHAGRTDVNTAGGGSGAEQRRSGRAQRGPDGAKARTGKTTTPPADTEHDKAQQTGSGTSAPSGS